MDNKWKVGDVFRIKKESDECFGDCLMIIDEVKNWGVICYMTVPGQGGLAYYRCNFKDMEVLPCMKNVEER
jgi:hypothetical protein